MSDEPILQVSFFRTEAGREPVRDWVKSLSQDDRKLIGEEIKLVQFRWPIGMPWVRKLEADLWEVRIYLTHKQIARIFFTVDGAEMILLHGFIKKSQKTPASDLQLARTRQELWQKG